MSNKNTDCKKPMVEFTALMSFQKIETNEEILILPSSSNLFKPKSSIVTIINTNCVFIDRFGNSTETLFKFTL